MRHIRIASRSSKLALVQAGLVRDLLLNLYPDIEISIVKVTTKGDRDKSDFLYKSESVGLFTREVEKAILEQRADMAVHSLKDLPTAAAPGLVVAAIPKRDSPADALVASAPITSIAELPAGATVGTSSLRRIAQLLHIRTDLKCVPLRGNVETRLAKVASGQIDAAIIACAGLNRLGLADKISAVLPPSDFIPAPAQGALAVQIRDDDTYLDGLLSKINDEHSRITAETERKVLAAMHGGCSIPLGVYAEISGDTITIEAMISDIKGRNYIRLSKEGPLVETDYLAKKLAKELLAAGGEHILNEIRKGSNSD
ncbi:MAG: hydroxymethylbilane synthase [Planctomycetota bacterium]|jgi:hydroxymethylbilane synthase